ncbi:SubName: Full=Uncharacterized protein {ECO:0000313/EMBL:CCA73004.1} [Serendipita indica DSM 11827]|nr:SubName: Full=Uncharacterized protein {ECO:0000313/EMBL:CCA73004.1} [Serendipita indica DSM 11827]
MFLLRRRVAPTTPQAGNGVSNDAAPAAVSSSSKSASRQKVVRRLSESEKARVSIYLRVLNAVSAALYTTTCIAKDQASRAVETVRDKNTSEMLYLIFSLAVTAVFLTISLALYGIVLAHQSLVWLCEPVLLCNVSFFSLQPYPPQTPIDDVKPSRGRGASQTDSSFASAARDGQSLIDLSSRSSEAGDTPPSLAPQVLSPTQLAVRSLSPAFGASINADRSVEMEEILSLPTKAPSPPPLSLGSILAKRNGLVGSGSERPIKLREMSTVSYPDINTSATFGSSDDGDDSDSNQMMDKRTYQSDDIDEVPALYEEDEEEDVTFPLPSVEIGDVPYTSSPGQENVPLGPETIDVLDPASRQASMDVAATARRVQEPQLVMPDPVRMPEPQPHVRTSSESSTTFAWVPPASRVATIISSEQAPDSEDSPRDIFSPTPATFPQPHGGMTFPFLRDQLQSLASALHSESMVQATEEQKKDHRDEPFVEPTPYPSPPFTPPSSRPPTMYSSMALQMPVPSTNNLNLATPDPFVIEKSQLSALYEEAKTDLEASKRDETAAEKVQEVVAPVESSVPEPVVPVPVPVSEPEPTVEEAIAPAAVKEIEEIITPGVLESGSAPVEPARSVSPVLSVGRGGMLDGSRIHVEDLASKEKTLVSSLAEDTSLNEVGTLADVSRDEDVSFDKSNAETIERMRSGWASGADDESTGPQGNLDVKKKKKKNRSKRPGAKKGVSFDEVPFVIGSDKEQTNDEDDVDSSGPGPSFTQRGRIAELMLNELGYAPQNTPSPSVSRAIPVPKTFEIEDEEEESPPALIPSNNTSTAVVTGSPVPMRRASLISEMTMSPRLTADEMSDSSSVVLAPGEFSAKQVDHYARWFARAHRGKSLPTIQMLRDQMKECSEADLAARLKLGSRSEATKLTRTLTGDDSAKGYSSSGGSVPPVRRASYRRRR